MIFFFRFQRPGATIYRKRIVSGPIQRIFIRLSPMPKWAILLLRFLKKKRKVPESMGLLGTSKNGESSIECDFSDDLKPGSREQLV
jgi:hypothetical protein